MQRFIKVFEHQVTVWNCKLIVKLYNLRKKNMNNNYKIFNFVCLVMYLRFFYSKQTGRRF